jgi:hypothetical protein
MPDSTEMLLQNILNQSTLATQRIENLSSNMVDKDAFDKFQIRLDKKLESVDKQLDAAQSDITTINSCLTKQEQKLIANTTFITNISSGGKWFVRVVFVAFLGVATSIVPSFLANFNKSQTVAPTSFATPYIVATPAPSTPAPSPRANP